MIRNTQQHVPTKERACAVQSADERLLQEEGRDGTDDKVTLLQALPCLADRSRPDLMRLLLEVPVQVRSLTAREQVHAAGAEPSQVRAHLLNAVCAAGGSRASAVADGYMPPARSRRRYAPAVRLSGIQGCLCLSKSLRCKETPPALNPCACLQLVLVMSGEVSLLAPRTSGDARLHVLDVGRGEIVSTGTLVPGPEPCAAVAKGDAQVMHIGAQALAAFLPALVRSPDLQCCLCLISGHTLPAVLPALVRSSELQYWCCLCLVGAQAWAAFLPALLRSPALQQAPRLRADMADHHPVGSTRSTEVQMSAPQVGSCTTVAPGSFGKR